MKKNIHINTPPGRHPDPPLGGEACLPCRISLRGLPAQGRPKGPPSGGSHESTRGILSAIFLGILIIFFLGFLPSSLASQSDTPLTGRSIIDKHMDTNNGYKDEISFGTMILFGANGKKEAERELELRKLEETSRSGEKAIIKIIKPADLKGTGLLSFQNKNRSDDQWLYLSAMKRTRRIAGRGKSGRFIGSEFTHEDLMPPDTDKYDYRYLKKEKCDSASCFAVESIPRFSDSAYSKVISWIGEDDYQIVKIHFFDKKGRLTKEALFTNYKKLLGKFWRPFKATMTNLLNGKKTELHVKQLKLQNGLTSADFTRMALER